MLWARGLIEEPDYGPLVGLDSLEVHGVYAHGWPVRLPPNHRLAIGVHATCKDGRLKRYAVALTAGTWQEGSWQISGVCTRLAPGAATEARAWFFGCWLLLQSIWGAIKSTWHTVLDGQLSTKGQVAQQHRICGTAWQRANGPDSLCCTRLRSCSRNLVRISVHGSSFKKPGSVLTQGPAETLLSSLQSNCIKRIFGTVRSMPRQLGALVPSSLIRITI